MHEIQLLFNRNTFKSLKTQYNKRIMIGYLLLLMALLLYIKPKYRHWSYFFYLSFMMGYGGGFGLWTDDVLGAKNGDLAIIYTFVISIVMIFNHQYRIPRLSFVVQYKWFIIFLCASVLFSSFYYHFTKVSQVKIHKRDLT